MKKILIAVDDGPTSEKVATIGFELGKQLKAEIALISVIEISYSMDDSGSTQLDLSEVIRNDFISSQKLLTDTVFKDYKIWKFLEEGQPFEMILKVAEEWEADLIVLGSHGKTGLMHLLMGSVAEKVMRNSTRPLLIIPTK
jgi:nucleotide-binding universal stress UspA family protein